MNIRFNNSNIAKRIDRPCQNIFPVVPVKNLAPPENKREFYLVSMFKKIARMLDLEFKIMIRNLRTHLDFLDVNDMTILLRVFRPFRNLVPVLPVIHDAAHGWLGIRRNLNKIEPRLLGMAESDIYGNNTVLSTLVIYQSDRRNPDLLVDSYMLVVDRNVPLLILI